MSVQAQASYNPTLTNYAQGYLQDRASALAQFVAPLIPVVGSTGKYKKFDDKNSFQTYDTSRAIGGKARRIEYLTTDPSYNCQPQALEIAIDQAERKAAGANIAQLEENKLQTLLSATILSHEVKVVSIMKKLAATANVGNWSSPDVDPINELDAQFEAIATDTGMLAGAIVFGLSAWRKFRSHAKVIKRMPGAALIGVTESQAATMMLNPAVQIRVAVLSQDTAKLGAAAAKQLVVGDDVFIFIRTPNPTTYDPGWMKNFTDGDSSVMGVREYVTEDQINTVLRCDWSEDIQLVGTLAGRRITLS